MNRFRPLGNPDPLPSEVNVAIQKRRFTMDSMIKRWAMSGLEGTKPATTEINWQKEKRA